MKTTFGLFLIIISMITTSLAELYITEFMAINGSTLKDEDGDTSDWIEIFNSGSEKINLGGYTLTNDATSLKKWTMPPIELDGGSFLLVFASEKNRRVSGSELHTNFKIASEDYLALVAPDGSTVITEFGSAADPLPPQIEDTSYGLM
jgi:hypothetical protein